LDRCSQNSKINAPASCEHALKAQKVIEVTVEVIAVFAAIDVHTHGVAVPRAKKCADGAARRQLAPIAPHRRAFKFFISGFAKRMGVDVARVHPEVERVHRFAFSRAIDAGNDQNDRERLFVAQLKLYVEQLLTQLGDLFFVVGFADGVA